MCLWAVMANPLRWLPAFFSWPRRMALILPARCCTLMAVKLLMAEQITELKGDPLFISLSFVRLCRSEIPATFHALPCLFGTRWPIFPSLLFPQTSQILLKTSFWPFHPPLADPNPKTARQLLSLRPLNKIE
jgi:hypothetical protein